MSCKRPILLAIDGVSRKLVNEAKCGVYVEPENSDAIANGAKELANKSAAEIQQMGEDGYAFAKAHFDRDKLAKEYTNKIQGILK
jgi:glycosyltransferase involved in cell wall biosynthesis